MEAAKIVRLSEDKADFVFQVELGEHKYKVTFPENYYKHLTGGKIPPDELVRKSFEFLLEREGPDMIMKQFELPIIAKYFPEYEDMIRAA